MAAIHNGLADNKRFEHSAQPCLTNGGFGTLGVINKRPQEQETDGNQIARRLIAEEAEHKTGFLDLGRLGLTELPEELFQLTHLTGLNLGHGYTDGDEWKPAAHKRGSNAVTTSLARLASLPLQRLVLSETNLTDLQPLASLQSLQSLNCSYTQVSDLQPLANLSNLLERCAFGCKPLKKTKDTDAIFENVHAAHREYQDDPETLEISVDTNAKVSLGEYASGGKNENGQPGSSRPRLGS